MFSGRRLIVVVAYGSPADLARCLGALSRDEALVVVDNSSDESVAEVCRSAGVIYLDPGRNLGFAAAVNFGAQKAGWDGEDLLLLNPDAVITSAAVDALQRALHSDADDTCSVAPRQRAPDGTEARISWPFPRPRSLWLEAFGLARTQYRGDFIVGSILLIRGKAWRDVGGLDENFFLYAEEADWQRRAIGRGWEAGHVVDVIAEHEGGGTSSDERRRQQLFHAGQETFIRTWFGGRGWRSYRHAAIAAAALRATLPSRRALAVERLKIYRGQPRVGAGLPRMKPPATLRIVHVVVTNSFAGTERYVCQLARSQAEAGHLVTVLGGEPQAMSRELGRTVKHRPAATPSLALLAARRLGHQDIFHAHLTSAEFVGLGAVGHLGAAFVTTRHIAKRRGRSLPARVLGRQVSGRVDLQLAISEYVARKVEGPSLVIHNGTPAVETTYDQESRTVLVAQRLEAEKDTATALRAFAASGLAASGWTLTVAGVGAEMAMLAELARDLGIVEVTDFVGFVAPLSALLRRASIFLAPALAEPMGLSVLEAMAHAVPAVASSTGGHLESVGVFSELIFAPGDALAAGAILKRLALDPPGRQALGEVLQIRQRSDFSLEEHLEKVDAAYDALLRDRIP